MASAPTRLACVARLIASAVALEPAPAITGTRPAAASITSSTTRSCSAWDNVGDSPVVPTGTRPWVPCATCHSTNDCSAASSIPPLRNGVIKATMEPRNMAGSPGAFSVHLTAVAP